MKGLEKSTIYNDPDKIRKCKESVSTFQTNSSSPESDEGHNYFTKKSPFSQNKRSRLSSKIQGKKLFMSEEEEQVEAFPSHTTNFGFVSKVNYVNNSRLDCNTKNNKFIDVSARQDNIYFYDQDNQGLQNQIDSRQFATANNIPLYKSVSFFNHTSKTANYGNRSSQSSSTSDFDNNNNEFHKKYIEYQEQKQLRMKQAVNYYATTDFKNYTTGNNNPGDYLDEDSDSESEQESNNDGVFLPDTNDCNKLDVEMQTIYLKISYLVPDFLYSKHFPKAEELKIKQSKSCPNGLANATVAESVVRKNNLVISSFILKCLKEDSISEMISKIISEINSSFATRQVNIRLIKKSENFSIRASKSSGYPDFDLPGKYI